MSIKYFYCVCLFFTVISLGSLPLEALKKDSYPHRFIIESDFLFRHHEEENIYYTREKEEGIYAGVQLAYQFQKPGSWYFYGSLGVNAGYAWESGRFFHSDTSALTDYNSTNTSFLSQAELRLGDTQYYSCWKNTLITPFLLAGVEWWRRNPSKEDPQQDIENYSLPFAGLGISVYTCVCDSLGFELVLKGKYFFEGKLSVNSFSENFCFEERLGFEGEIPLRFCSPRFTSYKYFRATPYLRYHPISKGILSSGMFYEPASYNLDFGIRLGFEKHL